MLYKDSMWRAKDGDQQYKGHEIWDHYVSPHGVNEGETDGEVNLDYDREAYEKFNESPDFDSGAGAEPEIEAEPESDADDE